VSFIKYVVNCDNTLQPVISKENPETVDLIEVADDWEEGWAKSKMNPELAFQTGYLGKGSVKVGIYVRCSPFHPTL
jgi:hypothetical protein